MARSERSEGRGRAYCGFEYPNILAHQTNSCCVIGSNSRIDVPMVGPSSRDAASMGPLSMDALARLTVAGQQQAAARETMMRRHIVLQSILGICLAAIIGHCSNGQSFTASTIAGTGKPGFSGDGGPANKGQLRNPAGVAVGADGSLYIADRKNLRVRKVDAKGNAQHDWRRWRPVQRELAGGRRTGRRGTVRRPLRRCRRRERKRLRSRPARLLRAQDAPGGNDPALCGRR